MIVITRLVLLRIRRVFRMRGQITIVIIDFREERLPVVLDADETMVIPGVTLIVEGFECLGSSGRLSAASLPEAHPRQPLS